MYFTAAGITSAAWWINANLIRCAEGGAPIPVQSFLGDQARVVRRFDWIRGLAEELSATIGGGDRRCPGAMNGNERQDPKNNDHRKDGEQGSFSQSLALFSFLANDCYRRGFHSFTPAGGGPG